MTTMRDHAARPNPVVFRRVAGHFPTGVAVMCTVFDDEPRAMTVNSFVTVSLDPPLILVSLLTTSRMCTALDVGSAFAVSVLSREQERASRWFAGTDRPRGREELTGFAWHPAPDTASPVLSGSVAYFDCTVSSLVPAGDHVLVLADVRSLGELHDDCGPLVFWRGGYRSIGSGS